jgi:hypothetical protein
MLNIGGFAGKEPVAMMQFLNFLRVPSANSIV